MDRSQQRHRREPRRDEWPSLPRRGRTQERQKTPREKWWRKNPQPLNAPRRSSNRSASAEKKTFIQKVRRFLTVIKAIHHVKNVSDNKVPKQIQKMTQTLITMIKPAAPDDGVRDAVYGNAKIWEMNTISILKDHYNMVTERELLEIKRNVDDQWSEQFGVAANRAKRDLGRRLLRETVDEAEKLIINLVGDAADTERRQTPEATRREERETGEGGHRPVTPPPPPSPQPTQTPEGQRQTTHAQVHQIIMYSPPVQSIPAAETARRGPDENLMIPPRQQRPPRGDQHSQREPGPKQQVEEETQTRGKTTPAVYYYTAAPVVERSTSPSMERSSGAGGRRFESSPDQRSSNCVFRDSLRIIPFPTWDLHQQNTVVTGGLRISGERYTAAPVADRIMPQPVERNSDAADHRFQTNAGRRPPAPASQTDQRNISLLTSVLLPGKEPRIETAGTSGQQHFTARVAARAELQRKDTGPRVGGPGFEPNSGSQPSLRDSGESSASLNLSIHPGESEGEERQLHQGSIERRPGSREQAQQTGPEICNFFQDDFYDSETSADQPSFNGASGTSTPDGTGQKLTRHIKTDRKKQNWRLSLTSKTQLIISDGNLATLRHAIIENTQIDDFPDATFRHILYVLEKLDTCQDVGVVILAVGFNNRKQQLLTAKKEAQRLYKMAKIKFPNASILFPEFNFSENLPTPEKETLNGLNVFLKQKFKTIGPIEKEKFITKDDNVQWTAETTELILQHWTEQGN